MASPAQAPARRRRGCGRRRRSAPAGAAGAGFGGAAAAAAGRGAAAGFGTDFGGARFADGESESTALTIVCAFSRCRASSAECGLPLRSSAESCVAPSSSSPTRPSACSHSATRVRSAASSSRARPRAPRAPPPRAPPSAAPPASAFARLAASVAFERSARSPATSVSCAARSRSRAASSSRVCSRCSRSRRAASSRACESACSASSAFALTAGVMSASSPPSPSSWLRIQSILPRMRVMRASTGSSGASAGMVLLGVALVELSLRSALHSVPSHSCRCARMRTRALGFLTTASLCTRRAVSGMGDAARDRMMGEIASAGSGSCASGDASSKTILIRGCDPAMAQRAGQFLPPQLGNVAIESSTTDDDFFAKLARRFRRRHVRAGRLPLQRGAPAHSWRQREDKGLDARGVQVGRARGARRRCADRRDDGGAPIIPLLREALGLPSSHNLLYCGA